MRLLGSTRNVSRLCNERFSWAEGGGKLHRLKLGILAGMLSIKSLDGFAELYGPKWAYHLQPVIALIELPFYENIKLARMNGWDLRNEQDEPWPWPDLTPPADFVWKQNFKAYVLAKEILFSRQKLKPDSNFKRFVPLKPQTEFERFKPPVKSWLDYTATND
jgi:hypothetical protein